MIQMDKKYTVKKKKKNVGFTQESKKRIIERKQEENKSKQKVKNKNILTYR